ncbi:MAG TPA: hypothetical protein VF158_10405, partial [Longimicrobiales bacterium]
MAYSKVERQFWNDEKVRSWPRTRREVWMYLLTSPHMDRGGGRLGCYVLDPMYAAADLTCADWRPTPEEVEAELRELHRLGRIVWDPAVRVVLLLRFFQHNQPENPNVAKAAAKDVWEVPYSETVSKGLLEAVETYLPPTFGKGAPCASVIADEIRARIRKHGTDSTLKGSGTVPQTLPQPFRNPEPEPEPEPEPSNIYDSVDTESAPPSAPPHVENSPESGEPDAPPSQNGADAHTPPAPSPPARRPPKRGHGPEPVGAAVAAALSMERPRQDTERDVLSRLMGEVRTWAYRDRRAPYGYDDGRDYMILRQWL